MQQQDSPVEVARKPGSPTKKSATKRQVQTVVSREVHRVSTSYEERGYTVQGVNTSHLQAMQTELNRERGVTESCQDDVDMLKKQLGRADERIAGLEKVRAEQAQNLSELEKVRSEQATHIKSLEQVRDQQKSHIDLLVQENSQLKRENEQLLNEKAGLQIDLQKASDYIQSIEAKCFEANKTSLELLEQVKLLEQYIVDLKSRIAIYIPVKNDPIDVALSDYINNYPDRNKLKIMFMRESDGVYEFGQKRVRVKVERGKILIQVGGGNLTIDQFLDQYTPDELSKLERKDPVKRMTERIAVQKVIGARRGVETSPVRRDSSPAKKRAV